MAFDPLVIQSGADWVAPMTVADSAANPLAVTNPVLEMRRDLNPLGLLLARLDTTGTADGTITILSTGHWTLAIPAAKTLLMPRGRGFWDVFGAVNGQQTLIASGIVVVRPRVNA